MTDKRVPKNLIIPTGRCDFFDITAEVKKLVEESLIKTGKIIIQVLHTTAVIMVQEKEAGFFKDFFEMLERIAPRKGNYHHNDLTQRPDVGPYECPNGDAHLRASLFPVSQTIIIKRGKLQLGRWQSIFLVEFDETRKEREIVLLIEGEQQKIRLGAR